jgi:membrane-associated phospholipid phosphatase
VSGAPEPTSSAPPAEKLAERLEAKPTPHRTAAAVALQELGAIDRAVYGAIVSTPTPTLDEPLRRLSNLASHSKLWLGVAGAMFGLGGPTGRRVAVTGVVAVGVTSAAVNLPMKFATRRARPDRDTAGVPGQRRVPMPETTSFPSGHAASAFAFAEAVGASLPGLAVPLRGLAAAVAYSRVHTGVHYPGDVVVGSLVGTTIGQATALAAQALFRRRATPH